MNPISIAHDIAYALCAYLGTAIFVIVFGSLADGDTKDIGEVANFMGIIVALIVFLWKI